MSWKILKKSVRIPNPQFEPQVQEANQILERLVCDLEECENAIQSMHQSSKKIPEMLIAANRFELKIAQDISNSKIFDNDKTMKDIVEEWHKFASDATSIGDDYIITIQKTFIDFMKQLKSSYAEMKHSIRLRGAIYNDVIKYLRKVTYYDDKLRTGANLVKLEEAKRGLCAAKDEYSKQTLSLTSELSRFLNTSIDMFHPSFEAFVASEIVWLYTCKRSLDNKPAIKATSSPYKGFDDSYYHHPSAIENHTKAVTTSFSKINNLSFMNMIDAK